MIKITFEIWEDERGINLKGHGGAKEGGNTQAEGDFCDAILPKFMEFAYDQAKKMGFGKVKEHKPFTIIRRTP